MTTDRAARSGALTPLLALSAGAVWSFGTNPLTESTLGGRDYVFTQGPPDNIAEGFGNQLTLGNPITAAPTGLISLAASVLDEKFDYEVTPLDSSRVGSRTVVRASVRGDFPGSPITLQYAFTLDGEKIAHLEIGS